MREATIIMLILTIIYLLTVLILPINIFVKVILVIGSSILCYVYYNVIKKIKKQKP